ncbi:ADP-ribose pyrophosphatase YjhB, NUDIX family [Streptomyces zhaozhouensis]|uniref:ADP-ribose pyrophosphatase YjhB, NUDIX family n=1 Tax=Streptomyces zhaozhouensis TaxID=1300267 RepID=A0A286DQH6_9ACTN|nr:NUDIX domain-containing protein [Streptomyces zhaozhouensis]SOD60937.1 ADP-ribose pyrophosphatase YjhB, NUDIX family [Streptomyces zhaozhouensis]
MTEDAARPLASGPLGMRLLAFDEEPEDTVFATVPVGYVLVAVWLGGRVLLVLVRGRGCWELPGGGIDPGESPREAAARELWEETGHRVPPERLRFVGFARTLLLGKGELRGALYTTEVEAPTVRPPDDEIAALHWWLPTDPPPPGGQLQTVDTHLASVTLPGRG